MQDQQPGLTRTRMSRGTAAWNGLLLTLVLLGPICWALDLDRYELWHDETYSLAAAAGLGLEQQDFTGPFTHADLRAKSTFRNAVSACLRNDGGNGILHVVLLRQWIQIAPRTVFGIRLSSFIAASITLLVIRLFVIDIFGDARAALITTALIAHNPLMAAAAMEIRSYPLAILFSSAAAWLMLRVMLGKRFRSDTLILALLASCALLSHYSTVYAFAGLGFFALVRVRERQALRSLILSGTLTALVISAWITVAGHAGLPVLQKRNSEFQAQVVENPEINTYFQATGARSLAEGIGVHLLWSSGNGLQYTGFKLRWLLLTLVVPAGLVLLMLRGNTEGTDRLARWSLLALAISAMVYAAALALISGHTVSFQHRYALFSMPFLCVAMALGMRTPGFTGMLLGGLSIMMIGATQLHLMGSDDDSAVGPDRYASRAISAVEAYRASPQCEPSLRFRTWNAAVLFNLIGWPSQLDKAVQLVDKQEQDFLVVAMEEHCPQQTIRIWARDGRHLRSEPRDPEDAPTETIATP